MSAYLDQVMRAVFGDFLHGYLYPFIFQGMLLTLQLALLSLLVAILLGVITALARLSNVTVARAAAGFYTTIVRGIPDIVLMFIIFFGGQLMVNDLGYRLLAVSESWQFPLRLGWDYVEISEFTAGVVTIGIIFGAYMGETFRGAILAVPKGEIEAGHAYGMAPLKVFLRITLPASVRHALPGFGNNWLVLVKTTALVSVIGLEDMVFRSAQAGGTTRQPFTFYFTVAVLYLVVTALSDVVLRWLNRRYSVGVRSV